MKSADHLLNHLRIDCHKILLQQSCNFDRPKKLMISSSAVLRAEVLLSSFLEDGDCVREDKWTQSIAVGAQGFVENTKHKLGTKAKDRKAVETGLVYQLREPQPSYPPNFGLENDDIGTKSTYF